jgi:putative glutamine amidotransferase
VTLEKPRIAIPLPTSNDPEYNERCWSQYAAAVEACAGSAVRVELSMPEGSIRSLLTDCSGILLPGSPADVQPSLYGEAKSPLSAEPDLPRERADKALLEEASRNAMPVLGICYGLQSINVWRGGSLFQDIREEEVHHSAGASVLEAHRVGIVHDSLLARILRTDKEPSNDGRSVVSVNSSHHQAVRELGLGLVVSAFSEPDGVVEAIENEAFNAQGGQFLLATQWHPERTFETSKGSRLLFEAFVSASAAWKASRS